MFRRVKELMVRWKEIRRDCYLPALIQHGERVPPKETREDEEIMEESKQQKTAGQ